MAGWKRHRMLLVCALIIAIATKWSNASKMAVLASAVNVLIDVKDAFTGRQK